MNAAEELKDMLYERDYYAAMNARYYHKLIERGEGDLPEYRAYRGAWLGLVHMASIAQQLFDAGEVDAAVVLCGEIAFLRQSLETREPKPPDRVLILESQNDENESHWGPGIRTYEQCMAERERRAKEREVAK